MPMTKTFIWLIAIMFALLGALAATEVPLSGACVIAAAYLMTPLSPLRKWVRAVTERYAHVPALPLLRVLIYLLPVILLAIGFWGIGQHQIIDTTSSSAAQPTITAQ